MFGTRTDRSGYGRGTNLKGSKAQSKNSNNSSSSGNGGAPGVPARKGTFGGAQDASGYVHKTGDRTPFGSRYGHNLMPVRGEQRIFGGETRNDIDLERGLERDDSSTKTLTRDAKGINRTREIEVRVEDQYGNPAVRRPSEGTVEHNGGRPSTGGDSGESGEFYGVVR